MNSLIKGICLIAIMGLAACAGEDSYDENDDRTPTFRTRTELDQKIKSIPLHQCNDPQNCSSSVGVTLLVHEESSLVSSAKMGQCTGFLFEENNIVALNAHCLSDLIRKNPQKCANYVAIKFPKQGSQPELVRNCKRIIKYSDHERIPGTVMDYALIEIEPVNRDPFKISNSPVQVGDQLKMIKIDPGKYSIQGTMDFNYCRVIDNSILNMDFLEPFSETLLAVEYSQGEYPEPAFRCSITKGNSGSPVLNREGELVGIAQSGVVQEMIDIIKRWNRIELIEGIRFDLSPNADVPNNMAFTNVQCIEYEGRKAHPDCVDASLEDNSIIRAIQDAYHFANEITYYANFKANFGIPDFVHLNYKKKGTPEEQDSDYFRSDYTQNLENLCFDRELFTPFLNKLVSEQSPLFTFYAEGYGKGLPMNAASIQTTNPVLAFMVPEKFKFAITIPLSEFLEFGTEYEYASGVRTVAQLFVEFNSGQVHKVHKVTSRFRGSYGPNTYSSLKGQLMSSAFSETEELKFEYCTDEFVDGLSEFEREASSQN